MLSFVIWCLFGGIVGWYFGLRTQHDRRRELQRNIAVGVVGSVLGGFLFRWSIAPRLLNIGSVLTAFVGAIALLAVGNWLFGPDAE